MMQPFWKTAWQHHIKRNSQLTRNPAVGLLGIGPTAEKIYVPTKTLYTNVHGSLICNNPKRETTQKSFDK